MALLWRELKELHGWTKRGLAFQILQRSVSFRILEQNLNSVFFLLLLLRIDQKIVLPNFYNKLYLKTDIWGHIRTISNSRYYSCKCDFQFLPVETKVHPCQQEPTPTWKLHQCPCRHGMGGVSSFLWLEGRVTVLLTSLCLCGIDGSDPGFPMLHFWSFLDLLTATSSSDITTEVTECAIRVADAVLSIFFV